MGKRKRKRYSPKFKFQVVLEVLRNPGTGAEVARVSGPPHHCLEVEEGVVGEGTRDRRVEDREVADAGEEGSRTGPFKKLFGREQCGGATHRKRYGLNRCCEAVGLSKGTAPDPEGAP